MNLTLSPGAAEYLETLLHVEKYACLLRVKEGPDIAAIFTADLQDISEIQAAIELAKNGVTK